METLITHFKKLLRETDTGFNRYLYSDINWRNRIIGIKGPRGVGKTTLMLQHIKQDMNPDDVLYVNADDIYFSSHRLLDLAGLLVQRGIHYFYIDEIHKYKEWSRELKLIYDYYSELNVVFSGSSVLDLTKGTSDLSRRAVLYHLYGLSFREYLHLYHDVRVPVLTLDDIIAGKPDFEEKLRQIINITLENDIPVFADLPASMGRKFKKLLAIIAKSVPFKPNMSKLADLIGAGRNQMPDYFQYIEDAGMIAQLRDDTGGIRGLGKVEKVYLDNPNLIYALAESESDTGSLRETFFLNQTRVRNQVISSAISDFRIGSRTFETGGKSKGRKQLASAEKGYIVRDGIEFSSGNILPLWWFGLNY